MAKEGPSAEHMQKIKEYMLKKYKDAQRKTATGWAIWMSISTQVSIIQKTMRRWSTVSQQKMYKEFLAKLMKQNNEIQVIMTIPEEEAK